MPRIAFQGFDNHPRQPRNTCGQAVIASVLNHLKPAPTIEQSSRVLFDHVLNHYGPDWPFRNMMTHPKIIRRALASEMVSFKEHSRATLGVLDATRVLRDAIDRKQPAIVLLDMHALNMGPALQLHWAVVVGYEVNSDRTTTILLSSWGREYRIPCSAFKRSWSPWFMPKRYRNYLIVVEDKSSIAAQTAS